MPGRSGAGWPSWKPPTGRPRAGAAATGNSTTDTNSYGEYGDPAIGTSRFYLSSNIRKGVPLTNLQGYINPEVDRLFAQAAVAVSHEEAQACYSKLQHILTHDVAMLWLFERQPLFFHNKRLKNVITGPNGPSDGLGAAHAGMKLRYIAMRLVKTVLVAIAVVLLSFFLIRLAPGDAATVMAGQSGYADEAYMKSLRAEYGLDQPLPVQLWKYVDAVAHGDLGTSYVRSQPVLAIIMERLPNTLLLDAFALVVAAAGGIWLGGMAARRPGSAGDMRTDGAVHAVLFGAAILAGHDDDAGVRGVAGLAAAFRHRDHGRRLHRPGADGRCGACTSCCRA